MTGEPDPDLARHLYGEPEDAPRGLDDAPDPPARASAPWDALLAPCKREWFTSAPPARTWLLRDSRTGEGVLPAGRVGMLVAEGGAGKTMALIQLAVAVATGSRWLGTFDVAASGRVLVVLGEEDAEEAQRRAYNAAKAAGPRAAFPDDGSIVVLPLHGHACGMLDPLRAPTVFARWLLALVTAGGFRAVLIDPLSRFAGPEAETDNAAGTEFVTILEGLVVASGATIVVAHHTNKASRGGGATVGTASARGSSGLPDATRWVATLAEEKVRHDDPEAASRLGELVTLAVTKSNYGARPAPVVLRRDREHGGALVALDHQDESLVHEAVLASDPRARKEAAKREAGKEAVTRAAEVILAALTQDGSPMSGRELEARARVELGALGRPTFHAALASLGLRTSPGPRGATLYHPPQRVECVGALDTLPTESAVRLANT